MKISVTIVFLLFCLFVGTAWGQTPGPIGGEMQVNSYTSGRQSYPAVAADSVGRLVVVWDSGGSFGTDTSHNSIQARRLDGTGRFIGPEFQVNTYTTNWQRFPRVAVSAVGAFVVVWQSNGSYGTDQSLYSIQAQRFDPVGTPVGAEIQVNSYTTGKQWYPAVAMQPSGDFVVVWQSYGSYGTDTIDQSIQGQRYDAAGARNGGEFQVNSTTSWHERFPSVAVGGDGSFAVVWQGGSGAQGQRYDKMGAPIGGEFQVSSHTSPARYPAISMAGDGPFTVVWTSHGSYGTDNSASSVQGQRFDETGTPTGGQFQVNSYTTGYQGYGYYEGPEVAVESGGGFVVVWPSTGSYGTDNWSDSVQGQRLDALGIPIGEEFQINSYTPFSQGEARVAVAAQANGEFVVVWDSAGSYDSDWGGAIQAQRFSRNNVFADGFESGDSRAWSDGILCIGCPDADFDFVVNGFTVSFLNQSTGDPILNYAWNFGDGSSPRFEENPVHTYGVAHTYNVRLTVSNQLGIDQVEKPVTVGNPP